MLTVHPPVQKLQELLDGSQHLLPGEVQKGNDSEVQLLQEIGQLMDIHGGGHQAGVMEVIQVANQQSHFVSCWRKQKTGCKDTSLHEPNYSIMKPQIKGKYQINALLQL